MDDQETRQIRGSLRDALRFLRLVNVETQALVISVKKHLNIALGAWKGKPPA